MIRRLRIWLSRSCLDDQMAILRDSICIAHSIAHIEGADLSEAYRQGVECGMWLSHGHAYGTSAATKIKADIDYFTEAWRTFRCVTK